MVTFAAIRMSPDGDNPIATTGDRRDGQVLFRPSSVVSTTDPISRPARGERGMNCDALRKSCGNAIRELIFGKPKPLWALSVDPLILLDGDVDRIGLGVR